MTADEKTMTLHAATIAPVAAMLTNLAEILAKAQAHLDAHGGAESALLGERLIYDMLPLVRQVQIACDTAKELAARLAGIENPAYEDTEATMDELAARIGKTAAFLAGVTPEMVNGREAEVIEVPHAEGARLAAADYAMRHALPNFYFHVVTAYAILRENGIPLGKRDYLAHLPLIENAAY
ncbi:MAG TPA: DUF1993 domain-containing protein [Candidatus Paceibacterota bacterium]|nr:DUF1993 domain-containing protein [Candidatus Paceibacterota bacterium]